MGDLRLITSAYPGKCRVCGTAHVKGDQVWWRKGEKGVMCLECKGKGEQGKAVTAPAPSRPIPPVPASPTAPTGPTKLPEQSGEGSHSVRVWESFADYVESAQSVKPWTRSSGEGCWYSFKESFYGTRSWDDAIALAEKGWDEVRPQVDALTEKIDADVAPMLSSAFTSYFDVSGGTVDVGRFLDGEPECMVETRLVKVAKPGRVVTLLISGGVLSRASTTDIIERGCAIVALVDSLEKMQHGCEIWLEMSCARDVDVKPGKIPVLTHLVKLKSAEDAMDVDMLMFAIAHPSRHRRLTFAVRRGEPNYARYGVPMESTCPVTQAERVGASLVLESLRFAGRTIFGEEWVRERLSEFGLLREEGAA